MIGNKSAARYKFFFLDVVAAYPFLALCFYPRPITFKIALCVSFVVFILQYRYKGIPSAIRSIKQYFVGRSKKIRPLNYEIDSSH